MNEALSNNKRVWKLYKKYFPQLDVYKISNVSSMIQYDSPKSIWELLDRMRMKIYAPEEYENAMKAYRDKMDREIEKMKKRQEKQAEEEQRRKEEEKLALCPPAGCDTINIVAKRITKNKIKGGFYVRTF